MNNNWDFCVCHRITYASHGCIVCRYQMQSLNQLNWREFFVNKLHAMWSTKSETWDISNIESAQIGVNSCAQWIVDGNLYSTFIEQETTKWWFLMQSQSSESTKCIFIHKKTNDSFVVHIQRFFCNGDSNIHRNLNCCTLSDISLASVSKVKTKSS